MADRDTGNSKRKRGGATSPHLPQLVPKQSTGGLFGCLKATLKFRFIAYILAQPPSCLFLLGLSLLAFCLWPLGVYVTYSTLPDLDVMLKWNAPLGRLPSTSFCVDETNFTAELISSCSRRACVLIPFSVPSEVMRNHCGHTLQVVVSGSTLKSRNERHRLLGDVISVIVEIHLQNESAASCHNPPTQVSVDAMVTYCILNSSAEAEELHVTIDDFKKDRDNSDTTVPSATCACNSSMSDDSSQNVTIVVRESGGPCTTEKRVAPEPEHHRHRGLVNLYLKQEQRLLSASRLYGTSVIVFIATIICALTICLTDRPPKPKQEGTVD